jgi:hypothetical protein
MKQTRLIKILAAGAVCAFAISSAFAQETTTRTTTTDPVTGTTTTAATTTSSAGTIMTNVPDSDYITFRTTTESEPVRYYYTKRTTIVDPTGRTVTWSAVRPDMPATVYYANEGNRVVVRRIVLSQPVTVEKKTTTTTTTDHRD